MTMLICRSIMLFEDSALHPTSQAENKLLLIQPVLNFVVPFIPTQLSFSLFVALSGLVPEKKYMADVRLIDTQSAVITSIPWEIEKPLDNPNNQSIGASAILTANIKNMVIMNEGRYFIHIFVDGEKIGEQFFEVSESKEGRDNHVTH